MWGDALQENISWLSEGHKSYEKFQLALEIGSSKTEQVLKFSSIVSLMYSEFVFQSPVGKTIPNSNFLRNVLTL